MEKKYAINLLKGGPDYATTDEHFFKIPFVMLSIAKRFSGKTCSLTQFLHILHKMGKLDRLILISPTFENNKHYFKGLPLDEVNDIIQPTLDASDIVMRKLEKEALEYDAYNESLKKWNELRYELKNNKIILSKLTTICCYTFLEIILTPITKNPSQNIRTITNP